MAKLRRLWDEFLDLAMVAWVIAVSVLRAARRAFGSRN